MISVLAHTCLNDDKTKHGRQSMTGAGSKAARRILVTGSRGKSSIVRLLHAAMNATGVRTYARITGVVPRELGPEGVRTISRSSGAHVEEMRWWLRGLPASVRGIVLENSAITPDLQALAGRWLEPHLTILSNTYPDHQEVWGPSCASAAKVLAAGIPRRGLLVVPAELKTDVRLLGLLESRSCLVTFAEPVPDAGEDHRASNMGLALAAIQQLGLEQEPTLQAMLDLPRDRYDFHVASYGGADIAMAFSVNDIASTRLVFRSLNWPETGTRLVYNHRSDRPERLKSFFSWMSQPHWREVLIIGQKPGMKIGTARYINIKNTKSLLKLFQPGDRVFGCGNIAGLPLSLAAGYDQ